MKQFLSRKVPLIAVLLITIFSVFTTYFFTARNYSNKMADLLSNQANSTSLSTVNGATCSYKLKRLNGYGFVKPLMFVESNCESDRFSSVKQEINNLIEGYKKSGVLNSASVYLKEYNNNDWMTINESEMYKPGSLLKVPELITFLKMEEDHPGILEKELTFEHPYSTTKKPIFLSQSIQLGQKYTIKQLLKYMIEYSDNNATLLLNANIDVNTFKKVFTDFGLQAPDWNAIDYPVNVKNYSLFLRSLYNASYLNTENSEFATELLSKCDFKDGILKGLPSDIRVAHKFGEAGDAKEVQLHESALVYINNNPYLLTVMTKGKDLTQLPKVISDISEKVYRNMLTNVD